MRNLKDVMNVEVVKEGIYANLIGDKELSLKVVESLIENIENNNICFDLKDFGSNNMLEVCLYKGEETGQYLFEARTFDEGNERMLNAYLEVLNEDLSIHEEYIDDVWSYDDWKAV